MIRKCLREFFLLRPGEQRAFILVSLVLVISLMIRLALQLIPSGLGKGPELEQFMAEAEILKQELRRVDSFEIATGRSQAKDKVRTLTPQSHMDPRASIVELNSADSLTLLSLKGIGPVFAGRIVKYRNLLGGFVCVEQLLEVYGMDSARFLPLLPFLEVDDQSVIKLDLNTAGFRDLIRHPYLEYEHVKALVRYRDITGDMASPEEIREHGLIPDTLYMKIAPYLICGP